MGTPCEVINGLVVVVQAPCNSATPVNVGFFQPFYLQFLQDARFRCDKPNAFNPALPHGKCFKKGEQTPPALANPMFGGQDVHWDAVPCDNKTENSATVMHVGSGITNTALANVIHVGSGGNPSFVKAFTKTDQVADIFFRTWRHTERLLKALLAHPEELAPIEKQFVELFLESGIRAYKEIHKEDER